MGGRKKFQSKILVFQAQIHCKTSNSAGVMMADMLYTTKERIFHVEFNYITKKYDLMVKKIEKIEIFQFFLSKTRVTRYLGWLISRVYIIGCLLQTAVLLKYSF